LVAVACVVGEVTVVASRNWHTVFSIEPRHGGADALALDNVSVPVTILTFRLYFAHSIDLDEAHSIATISAVASAVRLRGASNACARADSVDHPEAVKAGAFRSKTAPDLSCSACWVIACVLVRSGRRLGEHHPALGAQAVSTVKVHGSGCNTGRWCHDDRSPVEGEGLG
jgi:hypothetical protein